MGRKPPLFFPGALLLALTAALLAGCGSDSKKTSSLDPAGSEAAVAAGLTALANGDLAAANAAFRTAVAKDPSNPRANLGAAVTEVALVESDPDVLDILDRLNLRAAAEPRSPLGRYAARKPAIGRFSLTPRRSYDPLAIGRGTFGLLMSVLHDPPAVSEVQNVVKNKVLGRLVYAEQRLNAIEATPGFVWRLPPSVTGAPDTIEVDLGDVLLVDSVINQIQGFIRLLVAYNFDAPYGHHVDFQQLLAPASLYGRLHPDGASQLANARQDWLTARDRINAAVASIGGEVDNQDDDLVPQTVLDDPDFQDYVSGIRRLATALTDTVWVGVDDYLGNEVQIAINFGAFFTNPITDLKTKLPAHTFDQSTGEPVVSDPITFPDPTFNGLFPGMTNEAWRALIGPV